MEKPNTSFMGLPFVKSFVMIVYSLHFRHFLDADRLAVGFFMAFAQN